MDDNPLLLWERQWGGRFWPNMTQFCTPDQAKHGTIPNQPAKRPELQIRLHQRAISEWQVYVYINGWIYSWVIPTPEARISQQYFPFQIFERIMWKFMSNEMEARRNARKMMVWHNEVTNKTTTSLQWSYITIFWVACTFCTTLKNTSTLPREHIAASPLADLGWHLPFLISHQRDNCILCKYSWDMN